MGSVMALKETKDGEGPWTIYEVSEHLGAAYALSLDSHNPNIIYIGGRIKIDGTNRGALYKTTNGGNSFQEIGSDIFNPSFDYIKKITLDPVSSNIIYVSNGNYLFKSKNSGESWINITPADSSTLDVNAILVDPIEHKSVYIGTDKGVYYSSDSGQNWRELSNGLIFPETLCLELNTNKHFLYAGTIGGGIFRIMTKNLAGSKNNHE